MKSSSLAPRATSVSHQRITRWPPTSSSVSSTPAFSSASPSEPSSSLGAGAQRRDDHQQRHHRQVLEQQDAQHAAAVLALQLQPLAHAASPRWRCWHMAIAPPSATAPCQLSSQGRSVKEKAHSSRK
jgi:hypothetical protein